MLLVYLHGLNSSAQSSKARQLGAVLARRGQSQHYACPSLPHQPLKAVALAEAQFAGRPGNEVCNEVCFVGSSLGGFYATWLAEKHDARAVLINPAIDPHLGLRAYMGTQFNLYSGEKYTLGEEHMRAFQALCPPRVTPERYLLLVETGDEVLDYRLAVNRYAGARQVVVEGGDHSLRSFPDHIPSILEFAGIPGW